MRFIRIESHPESCCRPIPTSYNANHRSNRTRHLFRSHWSYWWFYPNADLIVTPAMNELLDERTTIQVRNPNVHTFTINHGEVVANFQILTLGQASHVWPLPLRQLTLVPSHPVEANNVIKQLFRTPDSPVDRQWYPTPETCEDPTKLNPTEQWIYDENQRLRKLKKHDRALDDEQRKAFLDQFN